MHMKDDNIVTLEARGFLKRIKINEDIDESTFDMWKSELQKDLPIFWETITGAYKKN